MELGTILSKESEHTSSISRFVATRQRPSSLKRLLAVDRAGLGNGTATPRPQLCLRFKNSTSVHFASFELGSLDLQSDRSPIVAQYGLQGGGLANPLMAV